MISSIKTNRAECRNAPARRSICPALLCLAWLCLSEGSHAAEYRKLSDLERHRVDKALTRFDLVLDPNPQEKVIRRFYVYTEDPFAPEDGFLRFFNYLHVTTTDHVLTRQLLMSPGNKFSETVLIQTELELVDPRARTLALIFPVRPINEVENEYVDLLIVTKDVFSLRFNANISLTGSSLQQLTFGVSESNIAGSNKLGSFTFVLRQYVMELLAQYSDPDFFETGHELAIDQGLILNRKSGFYEGIRGRLQFDYPLDSEETEWGYGVHVDYVYEPRITFEGNKIRIYEGPTFEKTERKYRWLEVNGNATATRSFGRKEKHNLNFGYGLSLRKPTLFEDFNLSGQAAQEFISTVLPIHEFQSFFILGYNYFWNEFVALYDVNTFSLEEWVRLGPSFSISNLFAARPILSDYNFLRPLASFSFTFVPIPSALFHVHVEGETRVQDTFVNNRVQADLLLVSPKIFGLGRLFFSGLFTKRWDDLTNGSFSLGGDNGLRALVAGGDLGNNLVRTNVEFRSIALNIWIFGVGGVVFYDWGAAFFDSDAFKPTHALGIGTRILLLPFSRSVFRIDVAIPVGGPHAGIANTLLTLGIGQAF